MTAALRYEWRRLWTIRSTYWLIGITIGLQAVFTLLAAWGASTANGIIDGEEVVSQVITLGASFGVSPLFTAYIVALFGVFSFGHEYRYGMVRATLTAVPHRSSVFVAKVLVTAGLAAVLAVACCLIGMLWSLLLVDTDGALGSGGVWQVVLGATLYTVLFALCALGLASLLRNQTGALALVLLIPLVLENVLRVILQILAGLGDNDLDSIAKVFPFDAGAQMFARPTLDVINDVFGYDPLGPVAGGLVMAGFTAILVGCAYALFLRRDA
jgi:ABC-2 type transport system permease protein